MLSDLPPCRSAVSRSESGGGEWTIRECAFLGECEELGGGPVDDAKIGSMVRDPAACAIEERGIARKKPPRPRVEVHEEQRARLERGRVFAAACEESVVVVRE